ncbi:hypothetical protein [Collimonas humicola]|uniref:hypothetical protein n=1 Tax=Collimonas humicola TaxID=2825886 RepID=UPI001B8C6010|nr:hypothetical protein [Collimonas humicola]
MAFSIWDGIQSLQYEIVPEDFSWKNPPAVIDTSKQLLRTADDKHYHQQLINAGDRQRRGESGQASDSLLA